MDVWRMIGAERAALVAALETIDDADWSRPSLCGVWTVRDIVGHLVVTASITPVMFVGGLVANGFRRDSLAQGGVRWITHNRGNRQLLEAYRSRIDARTSPPGPAVSWLGETVVHGEDIFRALGGYREHPAEHLVAVADHYRGTNRILNARRRIAGLSLRATDVAWQHGQGPEVAGPLVALIMAMAGRAVALDDVSGPGVDILRQRATPGGGGH
jgi:uncharacterized protein (TIGR03083 family)